MNKIIRGYFLLPLFLFYLTLTSGLPPGSKTKTKALASESGIESSSSSSNSTSIIMETLQEIISTTTTTAPIPITTTTTPTTTSSVGSNIYTDSNNGAAVSTTTTIPIPIPTISSPPNSSSNSNSTLTMSEGNGSGKETKTSTPAPLSTNTNSIEPNYTSNDSGTTHDDMHHSTTTIDTPVIAPLVQNLTKVPLRGKCNNTSQCIGEYTECRLTVCKCLPGYLPRFDNGDLCGEASLHLVELPKADPTMIGVVIGLVLMSVTLCVVLRLFAKARFRENRTIFNTPNPRLMNVSLLKGGSKTLLRGNSAPRSRRGSTASARSGLDVGTPTSPMNEHHHINGHHNHESGNGNSIPLVGASSRPKPSRQISTDGVGDSTPNINRSGSTANKSHQKFRHQDSVASNV